MSAGVRPAAGPRSAMRARMPPSPRLSARMMKVRYLSTITTRSDHSTSDRMPSTFAGVGVSPRWGTKHSLIA